MSHTLILFMVYTPIPLGLALGALAIRWATKPIRDAIRDNPALRPYLQDYLPKRSHRKTSTSAVTTSQPSA